MKAKAWKNLYFARCLHGFSPNEIKSTWDIGWEALPHDGHVWSYLHKWKKYLNIMIKKLRSTESQNIYRMKFTYNYWILLNLKFY